MSEEKALIQWSDFEKIDLRVGTVIEARVNEFTDNPSLLLMIDFGPLGIKKSSAQLNELYTPSSILKKQVVAVVNFEKKQIGKMMSECLVLGCVGDKGVSIVTSDLMMENGTAIS